MPLPIKTCFLGFITAIGMAMCGAVAEEPQGSGTRDENASDNGWLEPYDATLLSRRLLTQYEFEDYERGDEKSKLIWKLRWAFPLAQKLALGLQIEAPLTWAEANGEDDFGWGDMEARVGVVIRGHERVRTAIALNGKFATASSGLLGDDRLELRPLVALRWDATERLNVGANFEYVFTPESEGNNRVSAAQLKVPVAWKLSDEWSCFTSYKPQWNDVNGTWRHRLEAGVTWQFGGHRQYALSIGGELPLTNESFKWKGFLSLACYFK